MVVDGDLYVSECKKHSKKYIYIACPWAPMGGGMFKIADYLVQSQYIDDRYPELRALDSRGSGLALLSFFVILKALFFIFIGRISGRLVGVHVNVAERLSFFRKGLIILFSRLLGLPVVLHLHAAQLPAFYHQLPKIIQFIVRYVFGKATVCVVLGEKSKKFIIDELNVCPEKIRIVINGVPIIKSDKKKENDTFHILFLGNLMERKGVSDLLKALATQKMQENNNWKAFFAGGGDIEFYNKLAVTLKIEHHVSFVGWVNQEQAADLFAIADVLILPSYDEGLPLVILEALGRGVPVICTPVGEIPDFFEHKKTAYFVETGNIASIADALVMLQDDEQLLNLLGHNALIYYQEKFSFEAFLVSIYQIYDEVILSHH